MISSDPLGLTPTQRAQSDLNEALDRCYNRFEREHRARVPFIHDAVARMSMRVIDGSVIDTPMREIQ